MSPLASREHAGVTLFFGHAISARTDVRTKRSQHATFSTQENRYAGACRARALSARREGQYGTLAKLLDGLVLAA